MDNQIDNLYEKLRNAAMDSGISVLGVANITDLKPTFHIDPANSLDGLDRAICLGYHLSDAIIDSLVDHPTRLYLDHYKQVNYLLDNAALRLTTILQECGEGKYRALPIPASRMVTFPGSQQDANFAAHVSHRTIAAQAGLGWIGRSNLLVHPRYGARVRYATVLTDAPLPCGSPVTRNCGECTACIHLCPAQAIHERKEDYDLHACYAKLQEFSKSLQHGQYICGLCVKACRGSSHMELR